VARQDLSDGGIPAVDAQLDAQSQLLELVRGLPALQREVIMQRFAWERSPREIADEQGTSRLAIELP
jgi:DNA-directed RNA polymerase specialized sigma24 family protein